MKKLIWSACLFLLVACHHNRLDVKVSDIQIDLQIKRFDQLLFNNDTSRVLGVLQKAYDEDSNFIDLYTEDILRLGNVFNDDFYPYLQQFISDTVIARVADSVLYTFSDFQPIAEELTKGFQHYKFYFPEQEIPTIYTYVSGFNQSLMVAEDFIGVGLDKYLGSAFVFYQYLGLPQYKIRNMTPEKIVPDIFYAWALTEYPNGDLAGTLLSEMIYQGKLIYFTEAMCPDLPDSVLMGYSTQQIEWCQHNEVAMWSYWAEHKLLYSVERLDLQKYIGDAPFTNTFSQTSPGRTGVWTGWQIVRSYMNKHPEITLGALMEQYNAQELLSQSGYFPE